MRRFPACCACALFLAGAIGVPLRAQEEGLNWLSDYGEALRQARETHKPLFVEFRCER